MHRKFKSIVLLITVILSLEGCVQKEILDDINLISGMSFDYSEDQEIIGTILFPVFLADQEPKNKTFTAKADIKKSILQKISQQTADPIVTGSMEVVLFSKELAQKKGIFDLVDPFQRDPEIGSGLYLAVTEGDGKDVLEGDYGINDTGTQIAKLIEHNIKQEDLPRTNLHLFLFDFYQRGKTPYMPILEKIEENKIKLNGVALFKEGKMIDVVSDEKMFFFKLLVDQYSKGLHQIKLENGMASVRSIRSKHDFQLARKSPAEVIIKINVKGIVNENTGDKFLNPKYLKKIEKAFEQEINQECLALIENFRKKQLDPVGLGHFLKTQTRNFDFHSWKETGYQKLTVKIEPKVKIIEAGIVE